MFHSTFDEFCSVDINKKDTFTCHASIFKEVSTKVQGPCLVAALLGIIISFDGKALS